MSVTRNMIVIRDASGKVVAAQLEDPSDSEVQTVILSTSAGDTLHRVQGVHQEVYSLSHPEEFRRAINAHVESDYADIVQTDEEEIQRRFQRIIRPTS